MSRGGERKKIPDTFFFLSFFFSFFLSFFLLPQRVIRINIASSFQTGTRVLTNSPPSYSFLSDSSSSSFLPSFFLSPFPFFPFSLSLFLSFLQSPVVFRSKLKLKFLLAATAATAADRGLSFSFSLVEKKRGEDREEKRRRTEKEERKSEENVKKG